MNTTLVIDAFGQPKVANGKKTLGLVAATLAAAGFGIAIAALVKSTTVMSLLTQAVIYAIFALGLGFLLKQNGMVSFGQAVFFGLPGYLIGLAFKFSGMPPEVMMGLVIAAVGLFAFALGLVVVRVPGIAFGMLTLAIGQGFYVAASKSRGVTGGADGLNINLPQHLFGLPSTVFQTPASMFVICWLVLVLLVVGLTLLLKTRFGPLTAAIRENEERARFIGFRTLLPRAAIFAISAMISAVGGALSSLYTGFISPESLHWSVSGAVLIMVVLGGSRTLWGPAIGAVVYYLFRDYLGEQTTHWMTIFGVSLIVVIVLWPSGIAGGVNRVIEQWRVANERSKA
jgi:branched-chain amino acid transport system permease protein